MRVCLHIYTEHGRLRCNPAGRVLLFTLKVEAIIHRHRRETRELNTNIHIYILSGVGIAQSV
jgi:hypothetical protein